MSGSKAASDLVRRLWQYCNILRDDGLSYPDYVEQLTYLLFLKMAEESSAPIPRGLGWSAFATLDAAEMSTRYGEVLRELSRQSGMLGLIFSNARNKVKDPAKLRLLVRGLIGQTNWSDVSPDVKGDAYEGLLEKNARDTKSGAGQYFTPRPLVEAIVECVNPRPGEMVCDPACGTAGFLLAVRDHLHRLYRVSPDALGKSLRGVELVEEVARLAAMNLVLHGISDSFDSDPPIKCADSLAGPPGDQFDVVLTNPPFGIKGSVKYAGSDSLESEAIDDLQVVRPDFWVRTANKQLNFLQHIAMSLKPGGRAAVVVPDNVLYDGGAGAAIRHRLLLEYNLHTILRLPAGLFYAQGVKANVLFFDRVASRDSSTKWLWVYDLRSDVKRSLKGRPLEKVDLEDFVSLFTACPPGERSADDESDRWRRFSLAELSARPATNLDLGWSVAGGDKRNEIGLDRLVELSELIKADLANAMESIARAAASRP